MTYYRLESCGDFHQEPLSSERTFRGWTYWTYFEVLRETEQCVWLVPRNMPDEKYARLIVKGSNSSFAKPTKEEAIESWKIRQKRRLAHAKNALARAEFFANHEPNPDEDSTQCPQ